MKCKVTLALTDAHALKGELQNRKDFEGDADSLEDAVNKWKSLNGLDGIGVSSWPVVATEVKAEVQAEPKKGK